MEYTINDNGILDFSNPEHMSQAEGNKSKVLGWLGDNYLGVTQAALNVNCIFNPDACARLEQEPAKAEEGSTTTAIVLGVLILLLLLLVLR